MKPVLYKAVPVVVFTSREVSTWKKPRHILGFQTNDFIKILYLGTKDYKICL